MKYNSLSELFKATADAIRSKTGGTDPIVANDFPVAIEGISSGGPSGELIGYEYSVILPDVNTVWTDELKKILPYAFIVREERAYELYLMQYPICMRYDGSFYYKTDSIGVSARYREKTNSWDDHFVEYIPDWTTADDIGEYLAYEDDTFGDETSCVIWVSEGVDVDQYPFHFEFADPVAVYADGTGTEGGGEADHSMEDALVSGTLEHYVNDRVTRLSFIQGSTWNPFVTVKNTLKSVSMARVEAIPLYYFMGCTNLESADFSGVKRIEHGAFESCTALEKVSFPEVAEISNKVFNGCGALHSIVLPNATTIGDGVFYSCQALNTLDLPKVTSIGSGIFTDSYNVKIFILRSETVATLNGEFSEWGDTYNGYIYVPRALVDSYKSAQYWSDLASRIRALEDYTVDGTITGELDMSKI